MKWQGEADAEGVAAQLRMTLSGARQHLTALERDGLVTHRSERQGPGRPRHLFHLTPAGDALFTRSYADFTNELLAYVGDEDPALLQRIFERRADRRLQVGLIRVAGLSFPDKVREAARMLDEDGYLADFTEQPDGTYLLTEHNCAVLAIAQRFHHACSTELDYLSALLPEADVTRVAHRLNGGFVCSYLVARKAPCNTAHNPVRF